MEKERPRSVSGENPNFIINKGLFLVAELGAFL